MNGRGRWRVARFAFKAGEEFELKLAKLEKKSDEIARKAIHRAAGITIDEIRKNLNALPVDPKEDIRKPYRYLADGEKFQGVPSAQKDDLNDSLGITPISVDSKGDMNTKVGFDGYGSQPTKTYPKGIPNQLIARAIESGSSVREKHAFVRPAVRRIKKEAVEAMQTVIDEEYKKIMK